MIENSNLDYFVKIIAVTKNFDQTVEISNTLQYYFKVMGQPKHYKQAIPYVIQIIAKGYGDLSDVKVLTEFFPHSCHKILSVIRNGKNVRIPNLQDLLVDDLKVLIKKGSTI